MQKVPWVVDNFWEFSHAGVKKFVSSMNSIFLQAVTKHFLKHESLSRSVSIRCQFFTLPPLSWPDSHPMRSGLLWHFPCFGLVLFGCLHTPGTWSHSRGHYPSTSSLDWVWIQSERAKLKAWLTAYCYITLAAVYRHVMELRFNPARKALWRHWDSIQGPRQHANHSSPHIVICAVFFIPTLAL